MPVPISTPKQYALVPLLRIPMPWLWYVIISRSGKHESAERKTTIRGEENANPRKERGNTPKERTSCNIHYTEN